MVFITYLILLITTLYVACLAQRIPLKSTASVVDSQALAERTPPERPYSSPNSDNNPNASDLDLMDIVLLASVDGRFHALNRTSGSPLWSMSSSPSSASVSTPSALAPLVRTVHVDHDPEMTDETTPQELYIIEPQSGDIYVMATPTSSLQRFPLSMQELVDMSPYSFPGNEGSRMFIGRKETSLIKIELETGKIKQTLNSECAWDLAEDELDGDVDLDELEGSKKPRPAFTEIYIGRTDYHISIYTQPHGRKSPISPLVQNLSFSVYGPNNQDNHLQATYRRTKDDVYIQSLPPGEIISFKAGRPSAEDNFQRWGRSFNAPIVAIFDVLRKPNTLSRNNAFVLLQPRPHLQDVLPDFNPNTRLPNRRSAYVGMVTESGSLFTMSPTRFPLVAFGGLENNAKWSLIDGAIVGDPDGERILEVDAITKARKYKERQEALGHVDCTGDAVYTDRRCLVGVRPVVDGDGEDGRMKRLIDGPKDGRFPLPWTNIGQSQQLETLPTTNETAVPPGLGRSNPIEAIDESANRWWTKPVNENALLVAAFSLIIAMVSFWFGYKRSKSYNVDISGVAQNSTPTENRTNHSAEKILDSSIRSTDPISPGPVALVVATDAPIDQEVSVTPVPSAVHPGPEKPKDLSSSSTDANGSAIAPETVADDTDKEGEANGDVSATPGKRKSRRGKRGKKKKVGISIAPDVEHEGDTLDTGNAVPEPTPQSSIVISSPKLSPVAPSLIVSDNILGFGSHGTVVYEGSLQGRAVAVKRLLQDFVTLATREVSILRESDDHPNVIRYYYQEAHANFLYIALELCPASLADIIENPDKDQWRDIAISFNPKKALRQITSGLRHLHALKLVHRDIKPQNILISSAKPAPSGGRPTFRMLISDFGLCKKLDVDQTSFLPTAHGAMAAGTVGWRAPEILRGEVKLDDLSDEHSTSSRGSTGTATGTPSTGRATRLTKSVDIFALGCLFYYTLTNGGHPFGDRFEREVNIMKDEKNLDALQRFGEEGAEAVELISSMLNHEAYERPDTTTCLLHPFFWDPARRLNFLQDASDRFEIMCRDPKDPYLLVLEKDAAGIVGYDWHSRLDKTFIENLGKFRKYDGKSVQDLLRALRNKKHHYQDLPDHAKRHLGPMPEGFLAYFTRRFPKLFLHVHSVIGSTGLRTESMFRSYFELAE